MLKATIINLTTLIDVSNRQDTFVKAFEEQLNFLDIELAECINISQHPETIRTDLANALSNNNIVITIGGLGAHLNDSVKYSIISSLSLPTLLHINTFNRLKKQASSAPDDFLERVASFPKGCKVFECDGMSGFAMWSNEQAIVSLPADPEDCKNIMTNDLIEYLSTVKDFGYVVEEELFESINYKEALKSAEQLNGSDVCIECFKSIEGTRIVIIGREGAVKTNMLAIKNSLAPTMINTAAFNQAYFGKHILNPEAPEKRPSKFKKRNNKPNKVKEPLYIGKKIYQGLVFAFCVAIIVSGSYVALLYHNSQQNIKANAVIQELFLNPDENASAPSEVISPLKAIYVQNNDTVGWIKIENTNINYPVVKSSDNEYYTKNDFNKKSSKYGIPFADFRNNFDTLNKNIIIQGNNLKDKQMFHDLVNYKNNDFYKLHPIINFDTIHETGKYKIFSVFLADKNNPENNTFDYQNFIDTSSPEEVMEFVYNAQIRSLINIPVDVNENDQLITLSTNVDDFDGAKFVVVARKIRDNETTNVSVSKATSNGNVIMPEAWYKKNGGSAPSVEPFTFVPFVSEEEKLAEKERLEQEKLKAEEDKKAEEDRKANEAKKLEEEKKAAEAKKLEEEKKKAEEQAKKESEEKLAKEEALKIEEQRKAEEMKKATELKAAEDKLRAEQLQKDLEEEKKKAEASSDAMAGVTVPDLPKDDINSTSSSQQSSLAPPANSVNGDTLNKLPAYSANTDVFSEQLKVIINNNEVSMDAYTLINQIVENETRGKMHPEATDAQVIATYTFIKYNNAKGVSPSVSINTDVSQKVIDSVNRVLGKTIRYNGQLINSTYHSTSRGQTTSSGAVWSANLPYLVPVDSPYDEYSPYYKNTFQITDNDLANKIYDTYGIDLYKTAINPSDWIKIDTNQMAPGGYVGIVSVGGYDKAIGGTVGLGTPITGRSIREKLLDFALKSTSFEISYNEGNFTFTTYGYGHGVGMSQWGAQGMAEDGYNHEEILTHYFKGTTVEKY